MHTTTYWVLWDLLVLLMTQWKLEWSWKLCLSVTHTPAYIHTHMDKYTCLYTCVTLRQHLSLTMLHFYSIIPIEFLSTFYHLLIWLYNIFFGCANVIYFMNRYFLSSHFLFLKCSLPLISVTLHSTIDFFPYCFDRYFCLLFS